MSQDNCIFCKIIAKEIPAQIVYENEHVLAFDDLNPYTLPCFSDPQKAHHFW